MDSTTYTVQEIGSNTLIYFVGALVIVLLFIIFIKKPNIKLPFGFNLSSDADNKAQIAGDNNNNTQRSNNGNTTNDVDIDGNGNVNNQG
jgi:hypothetical protein